jgi:hypothetical protein
MTVAERLRSTVARAAVFALAVLFSVACEDGETRAHNGSETHFLSRCGDDCGAGLTCVCGVCTTVCAETTTCAAHGPAAVCSASSSRADGLSCAEQTPSFCDVHCRADVDCGALGSRYVCDGGYCRASGGDSGSPPLGAPLSSADCQANRVGASELLVLGDSLIELSGMVGYLDRLGRAEGSLVESESYRDRSSSLNSLLAQSSFTISSQYAAAALEGPARIVVMNGGLADMLQEAACSDPPTADCPLVVNTAAGARSLLSRMADDGVEAIVYAFYPDPIGNPGLLARIDVLRPLIETACRTSRVPCHFLDLRSVFAGHYDDYVGPDGLVFSASGADATAQAIWSLMKARCVAP